MGQKDKRAWERVEAKESAAFLLLLPLPLRTFISFSSVMNVKIRPTIKQLRPRGRKGGGGERSSMRQKLRACMFLSYFPPGGQREAGLRPSSYLDFLSAFTHTMITHRITEK